VDATLYIHTQSYEQGLEPNGASGDEEATRETLEK
jgi:hypothetical protein